MILSHIPENILFFDLKLWIISDMWQSFSFYPMSIIVMSIGK